MGVLDFLRGKHEDIPDVGREEEFEDKEKKLAEDESEQEIYDNTPVSEHEKKSAVKNMKKEALEKMKEIAGSNEEPAEINIRKPSKKSGRTSDREHLSFQGNDFAIEKIKIKMEEIEMRNIQVNEKIMRLSETIGELRAMNISNEKKILSSMKEADKVVDMFNEIKPNELRMDYPTEKADLKKMDADSLKKEIESLRKELFKLRLSVASTHVKDNSQFKKLRVRIAQSLTCLNQKESAR